MKKKHGKKISIYIISQINKTFKCKRSYHKSLWSASFKKIIISDASL